MRLGLTGEWMDILYSVPAVQIFGAGSVSATRPRPPTSSRALPAVRLPVWGGRGDRGPGPYTWNASSLLEALPLYCVFEKLCTDPQVKWKGPLIHKHNTHLLRLKSLHSDLILCCLQSPETETKLKSKLNSFKVKSCKFLIVRFKQQSVC